jgi:uncharacterized protein YijF (DUF1287 family)
MRKLALLTSAAVLACAGAFAALAPLHPQTVRETSAQRAVLARLSAAAFARTTHTVRYDPAYVKIGYPGGDVPADTGVCTDEVIRAYRALGIDLQKAVHEDMQANFRAYPNQARWALAHTDTNIDHRRVPNLRVFFTRKGESLPVSANATDYAPGELVTWDLGGGVGHIGMVVNRKAPNGEYMLVHNIGQGPKLEDVLFAWKITGHYRYFGPQRERNPLESLIDT